MDPYQVLFVHPTAPEEVIQAAYRALARRYHPDQHPEPESEHRMAELNAAYALIRTPELRAAYALNPHLAPSAPFRQPAAPAPEPNASEPIRNRWHRAAARATAGEAPRSQGSGAAARASETVMDFGRYQGWSLAEIARTDRGYLSWLRRSPGGRRYQAGIDQLLRTPA